MVALRSVWWILLVVITIACSTDGDGAGASAPGGVGRFGDPAGVDLGYPTRVAVGSRGVVFVSDARAGRVVGLSGGRVVVAIEGIPGVLGVAASGDQVFAGSRGRGSVEVYDLHTQTFVRALGSGPGQFAMPNAIAVASDGTVYVVDSGRDVVKSFDRTGAATGEIGGTGTGAGQFRFPVAVAVDDREILVADQGNHRVQVFGRDGTFVRAFGFEIPDAVDSTDGYRGGLTRAQGIALDSNRVYVLDAYHAHVQLFDREGTPLGVVGRRGRCPACTGLALDVALSPTGQLLLSDPEQQRLVVLSPTQEVAP